MRLYELTTGFSGGGFSTAGFGLGGFGGINQIGFGGGLQSGTLGLSQFGGGIGGMRLDIVD